MAGGLFSVMYSWCDVRISSARTVLFMTLSSRLAECTGDGRYKEAAILSAKCIKTWMLDSATTLIKDCLIDARTAEEDGGAVLSPHLTGIAIEGFSVLGSITGDESWRSLAIDIAIAAMHYHGWHDIEGILVVGSDGDARDKTDTKTFKGLLNRGLLIAYQYNRSNRRLCRLIRSYINVQCNALLDLSRFQNSYGVDWRGPYVGPFFHGQMAAIDTLVAAIGVNDV
ncbi:hypothetical protein FRC03_010600 [Tulasnella sp. 419]|nr:hypothetical protein FRC03_010600 [Tulasnella sp. 419]